MKINRGVKQEVEVKGRIFSLLLVGCAIFSPQAFAEWTSLSAALPEADIRRIAVDPTDSKIIYAASEKRIYKSPDDGHSWAQVFGLWGLGNKIQFIYVDPSRPGTVYAAAENGVWVSTDSGKKWNLFYRGVGGETKAQLSEGGLVLVGPEGEAQEGGPRTLGEVRRSQIGSRGAHGVGGILHGHGAGARAKGGHGVRGGYREVPVVEGEGHRLPRGGRRRQGEHEVVGGGARHRLGHIEGGPQAPKAGDRP